MEVSYLRWLLLLLALPQALWGQVPLEKMSLPNRLIAGEIIRSPDFTFQTTTQPAHVRVVTMEKLFDHPRLAAAMWRECQFVPKLYAFALPARGARGACWPSWSISIRGSPRRTGSPGR